MSHEDYLQPEELDAMKAKVNAPQKKWVLYTSPPPQADTAEMSDLRDIDRMITTKRQIADEIVAKIASLEARLSLLKEATGETAEEEEPEELECEGCQVTEHRTWILVVVAGILIVVALLFGQYTNEWSHQRQEEQRKVEPLPIPNVVPPQTTLEQQAALGGAAIPFPERSALADAFGDAAERLERGDCRFTVDESLRAAIARQPTSGQWASTIDPIIQTAHSTDEVIYAKNLRLIAQGLRQ